METRPPDDEPPRSRFEDLSDIPVPSPARGARSRPAIVTMAAVVLFVAALMNAIVLVAFSPGGPWVWVSAGLAVAQAAGALLVTFLVPLGRPLGIALGAAGFVIGLEAAIGGSVTSGLITMGLNAFVIYALAASGPSFRRG